MYFIIIKQCHYVGKLNIQSLLKRKKNWFRIDNWIGSLADYWFWKIGPISTTTLNTVAISSTCVLLCLWQPVYLLCGLWLCFTFCLDFYLFYREVGVHFCHRADGCHKCLQTNKQTHIKSIQSLVYITQLVTLGTCTMSPRLVKISPG